VDSAPAVRCGRQSGLEAATQRLTGGGKGTEHYSRAGRRRPRRRPDQARGPGPEAVDRPAPPVRPGRSRGNV